jgi:peptidoglycan hydrolase-like protein with peptidoglycan-binding domain
MGLGYLKVMLYCGENSVPVANDRVLIVNTERRVLYDLTTDENGNTDTVPLTAPDREYSRDPYSVLPRYSVVDVDIPSFRGFKRVIVHRTEIFDTVTTILPVQLHPLIPGESVQESVEEYFAPIEHGVDLPRDMVLANNSSGGPMGLGPEMITGELHVTQQEGPIPLANDVPIPEYITVHLGYPNEYARNVTLPFSDYIKNVASSEIYPTWDEAALYANIYAQISFALNRMFTLWYRSRGFDFDITNNTAFDQAFVEGRWIFENISQIVDGIFNNFIRRMGRQEPFFALYCNGTTSTCNGLSQWGSQFLAQEGYTPIQILRNFYPNDIMIVESNNFGEHIAVYPGTALLEGSAGDSVRLMQFYLNRIHGNFPAIPTMPVDGIYGPATRASVMAFQRAFNLVEDGIIGRSTWYAIVKIFVAVANLAELNSEGLRIGIGATPPSAVLRMGSSGEDVVELQFILDYISYFYDFMPHVLRTSIFGENTRDAVFEFQRNFGLVVDGIVGVATWEKLYSVYRAIQASLNAVL